MKGQTAISLDDQLKHILQWSTKRCDRQNHVLWSIVRCVEQLDVLSDGSSKARHLKGQTAIEYLTTYGWAILMLVIVIGVIGSMFSPSFLIAEQCNIDKNNLPCNAQMYNDGENLVVVFKMLNSFGYPVKIEGSDVEVKDEKGNSASSVIVTTADPTGIIDSGESVRVDATFLGAKKPVNSLFTVNVVLDYTSCAQEINPGCTDPSVEKHTKSGKIIARVID